MVLLFHVVNRGRAWVGELVAAFVVIVSLIDIVILIVGIVVIGISVISGIGISSISA